MNFNVRRTTQVEKMIDYSLFLRGKRRHFNYEKTFLNLADTTRFLSAVQ
jgi:hypothetical protein